jgi:predicted nucleic acid-binding Zn ribbon protein
MEIILFVLGIIFFVVGLPLCFTCEIQTAWEKRSGGKISQAGELPHQHRRRNRGFGVIFMAIGVILIILSFAGTVM